MLLGLMKGVSVLILMIFHVFPSRVMRLYLQNMSTIRFLYNNLILLWTNHLNFLDIVGIDEIILFSILTNKYAVSSTYSKINVPPWPLRGHHDRDRMVIGFTTTYAISADHHWCWEFESQSGQGVQHYVIKFVKWLATGRWFSMGTPVSSTNKTDRHDITDILLKVVLNTITITVDKLCFVSFYRTWHHG